MKPLPWERQENETERNYSFFVYFLCNREFYTKKSFAADFKISVRALNYIAKNNNWKLRMEVYDIYNPEYSEDLFNETSYYEIESLERGVRLQATALSDGFKRISEKSLNFEESYRDPYLDEKFKYMSVVAKAVRDTNSIIDNMKKTRAEVEAACDDIMRRLIARNELAKAEKERKAALRLERNKAKEPKSMTQAPVDSASNIIKLENDSRPDSAIQENNSVNNSLKSFWLMKKVAVFVLILILNLNNLFINQPLTDSDDFSRLFPPYFQSFSKLMNFSSNLFPSAFQINENHFPFSYINMNFPSLFHKSPLAKSYLSLRPP